MSLGRSPADLSQQLASLDQQLRSTEDKRTLLQQEAAVTSGPAKAAYAKALKKLNQEVGGIKGSITRLEKKGVKRPSPVDGATQLGPTASKRPRRSSGASQSSVTSMLTELPDDSESVSPPQPRATPISEEMPFEEDLMSREEDGDVAAGAELAMVVMGSNGDAKGPSSSSNGTMPGVAALPIQPPVLAPPVPAAGLSIPPIPTSNQEAPPAALSTAPNPVLAPPIGPGGPPAAPPAADKGKKAERRKAASKAKGPSKPKAEGEDEDGAAEEVRRHLPDSWERLTDAEKKKIRDQAKADVSDFHIYNFPLSEGTRVWMRRHAPFLASIASESQCLAASTFILNNGRTVCHYHTTSDRSAAGDDALAMAPNSKFKHSITGVPYGPSVTPLRPFSHIMKRPRSERIYNQDFTLDRVLEFFINNDDNTTLHCGCLLEDALVDFYFWKKVPLWSPSLGTRELLGKPLKPRDRAYLVNVLTTLRFEVDDMYRFDCDGIELNDIERRDRHIKLLKADRDMRIEHEKDRLKQEERERSKKLREALKKYDRPDSPGRGVAGPSTSR